MDADGSNSTKAQTGEVPTGSQESNSTKAPTGSEATANAPDGATEPSYGSAKTRSRSRCASSHQLILDKLAFGKKLQIVPKRQPGRLPISKMSNSTNLTLAQSPTLKWYRLKRKHVVPFESQIDRGLSFVPVDYTTRHLLHLETENLARPCSNMARPVPLLGKFPSRKYLKRLSSGCRSLTKI